MRALLLLSAVAFSGCGDPRDAFVGMFAGEGTWELTWSDGSKPPSEPFGVRLYIAPAKEDGRLLLSELCNLSAHIDDGDSFSLDPKQCPGWISVQPGLGECEVFESVGEGTGTVRGDALVLDYAGDLFIQCPGGETDSATTVTQITATRQ